MDKDRHEFAPSGFRSPASAGLMLTAYRSLLGRYEETKASVTQLCQQVHEQDNENKRLEKREIVRGNNKKKVRCVEKCKALLGL